MHTNSKNQEYKHPFTVNGEKHKPKVCYKPTKEEFKSWKEEKTKENQPQVKSEPFCLLMWIDAAPENKIVKMIDSKFRNGTINGLIDYLYFTKSSETETRIIQRIFDWREKHCADLVDQMMCGYPLERQIRLWLKAYNGENKKWNSIVYKNYRVIDPVTGKKGVNMVNLDARLTDYVFFDKDAKCDGLVIEASLIPLCDPCIGPGDPSHIDINLKDKNER